MQSPIIRGPRFALFVLAIGLPGIASAERLFVPVAGLPSTARGIARSQALALDTAALGAVRAAREVTLTEFPLGADATATLTVERFDPFTAGATAVVMEDAG